MLERLVITGMSRYTPYKANTQEPIESARQGNSIRLLLYHVVPRSRTITRTKNRPTALSRDSKILAHKHQFTSM